MKNLIGEELKALKDYLIIVKSKVTDVHYALTGFKQIIAPDKPWFVAYPTPDGEPDYARLDMDLYEVIEVYDIKEIREEARKTAERETEAKNTVTLPDGMKVRYKDV